MTLGPGPEAIPSPLFSTLQQVNSGGPIALAPLPLPPGQISPVAVPGGLPPFGSTTGVPVVPGSPPLTPPPAVHPLIPLTPGSPPIIVSTLTPPTVPVPSYPTQLSPPAGPTPPTALPPSTPVYPGIPTVPETPEAPGMPGSPGTPGTPSSPGTPGSPGSPSAPGTPVKPISPILPPPEYPVPEPALGLPAGFLLAMLGSLALRRHRTDRP
jgi:hypothetical protein